MTLQNFTPLRIQRAHAPSLDKPADFTIIRHTSLTRWSADMVIRETILIGVDRDTAFEVCRHAGELCGMNFTKMPSDYLSDCVDSFSSDFYCSCDVRLNSATGGTHVEMVWKFDESLLLPYWKLKSRKFKRTVDAIAKEGIVKIPDREVLQPTLTPGSLRVFISYRREDSADICGRITDHLRSALGSDFVFQDVDAIAPGTDFRNKSLHAVRQSDVLLAVIGPEWQTGGRRSTTSRLDEESDLVRREIEEALTNKVQVVPVLVRGATMPLAKVLPLSIQALANLNAVEVRSNNFRSDFEALTRAISVPRK